MVAVTTCRSSTSGKISRKWAQPKQAQRRHAGLYVRCRSGAPTPSAMMMWAAAAAVAATLSCRVPPCSCSRRQTAKTLCTRQHRRRSQSLAAGRHSGGLATQHWRQGSRRQMLPPPGGGMCQWQSSVRSHGRASSVQRRSSRSSSRARSRAASQSTLWHCRSRRLPLRCSTRCLLAAVHWNQK